MPRNGLAKVSRGGDEDDDPVNSDLADMKRVKLVPHDSTDSRESIEMDEYSDEEDEVFLRHGGEAGGGSGGCKRNGASRLNSDSAATRPLMKKKKRGKVSGGLSA